MAMPVLAALGNRITTPGVACTWLGLTTTSCLFYGNLAGQVLIVPAYSSDRNKAGLSASKAVGENGTTDIFDPVLISVRYRYQSSGDIHSIKELYALQFPEVSWT